MRGHLLLLPLFGLLALAAAAPGTCRAGGAGYAYVFEATNGETISLRWQTAPLSQLTVSYWVNILDDAERQQNVFAYSVFSSTGRYGVGGAPYEQPNELLLSHSSVATESRHMRICRATSRSPDMPVPVYEPGSWVHMTAVWVADPSDSPHGQLALYIDGALTANATVCAVGTCDLGMPLQPGGIVHLGQEADAPYGEFDVHQAFTGAVDE
jgi:hypothetical protein